MTKRKRRISVKSAKAKGRNLQNWIAQKISKLLDVPYGKDELIEGREIGQSGIDIKLYGEALEKFPFSVEAKAVEKWAIHEWIKQAKSNQKQGTEWLLICKRSRQDPVVVMDVEAFFRLYEELLELRSILKTTNG